MRLHFTFWLFLFALNCFSMSKEFQEALSIFRDAIPSYSDIPNIDNSNIQYLITGKIYKIDEHAQICAPDEFRWNTSLNPLAKREVLGALVLQEKLYKCNLRPIDLSSLTKAGTKIRAASMKIWRFNSTGLSSSPSVPSFEYSLLFGILLQFHLLFSHHLCLQLELLVALKEVLLEFENIEVLL